MWLEGRGLIPDMELQVKYSSEVNPVSYPIDQCFSNWVPRNLTVPQNIVMGSERKSGINT
jgi:hypothetical protein